MALALPTPRCCDGVAVPSVTPAVRALANGSRRAPLHLAVGSTAQAHSRRSGWQFALPAAVGLVLAGGDALCCGSFQRRRRCSHRPQRGRPAIVRLAQTSKNPIPTEFYSLLGLPLFTSDRKEVKAAYRRVVKLVHPDILGAESRELQELVTEAYETLTDPLERKKYDYMLKEAKPSLAESEWSPEAPFTAKGVFVDETICEGCYKCVEVASSTFEISEEPFREGRAHVTLQYGDTPELVDIAITACPVKAISYVSRKELPLLEYAMTKVARQRFRSKGVTGGKPPPSPFQILQDQLFDELIELDMDLEKTIEDARESLNPEADMQGIMKLEGKSKEIYDAASLISAEVRSELWPQLFKQKEVFDPLQKGIAFSDLSSSVTQNAAMDLRRVELKVAIFRHFDQDRDGYLYSGELRCVAEKLGFDGDDEEWDEEFEAICESYGANPVEGLDINAMSELIDSMDSTDTDLAAIVSDFAALKRAGR